MYPIGTVGDHHHPCRPQQNDFASHESVSDGDTRREVVGIIPVQAHRYRPGSSRSRKINETNKTTYRLGPRDVSRRDRRLRENIG